MEPKLTPKINDEIEKSEKNILKALNFLSETNWTIPDTTSLYEGPIR